jgi:NAD(P)-dependent dehydrogenase (short-subunit alcohol dehydrogenase family)
LITGATNGIGKVAALELAKMGATVVIVGRNAAKTQSVVDEIRTASGNTSVDYLLADLSSMAQVRQLADAFRHKYTRLDVLVNNAGGMFAKRQETVDGFEMTFALNHLAYFLLTDLLLDILKASAPARIVNVSSDAHRPVPLDFDDLQHHKYGMRGFLAYSRSKLANVLFSYELAARLAGTGVTANVLHPGTVATGFGHNNAGLFDWVYKVIDLFAISPEKGAETIVYLASSQEVEGVTGKYWNRCKAVRSSKVSYDQEAARRLWEISEQMTRINQPAGV